MTHFRPDFLAWRALFSMLVDLTEELFAEYNFAQVPADGSQVGLDLN